MMGMGGRNGGFIESLVALSFVVGGLTHFLYMMRTEPWSAPIGILLGLGGLVLRSLALHREHFRGGVNAVDPNVLRKINVLAAEPWLRGQLRGQDETCMRVVHKIQQNLMVANRGRTLGNFLLVGPTGTGKTYLGELLAQALYPGIQPVILRMNQYKQTSDIVSLMGSAAGGMSDEGGALTRPVLEEGRRVVVLDEIEKCHPDIQHSLYSILDAAEGVDKGSGRRVSFSACVFIATCNAGASELRSLKASCTEPALWMGRSRELLTSTAGFDRAFLARFDEIFLMDALSPVHVAEVACLAVMKHWANYGIEVIFTSPEVLMETVLKNEEFKQYGVRQLSSYIRSKSDQAVVQAQSMGFKRIQLALSASGEFIALPGSKAA